METLPTVPTDWRPVIDETGRLVITDPRPGDRFDPAAERWVVHHQVWWYFSATGNWGHAGQALGQWQPEPWELPVGR